MMKTLIQKELRENLKLALPGLLIFSALLADICLSSETQPLLKNNTLGIVELFCNMFGLALGWFQISHEKHRDLWAFLIHRPLTRTRIFFAKVVAGLILYSLTAALPLLVWVAASAIPGHFASPFEWEMALPVVGILLMGMVWYFAGMLTGLRQARWYASRGLGLLAAMFIYVFSEMEQGYWRPFIVILVGGTFLAVAAWGAFLGGGSDRGQPAWGRRALSATLVLALVCLLGIGSANLIEVLMLRGHISDSVHSEIMQDGTICEVIQRNGQPTEIVNLAGIPLKDPDNGRKMSPARFDKLVAESYLINVEFGDQSELRNHFKPDTRFFCLLPTIDRIRWFWKRNGELAGYDTATRRLVDSIKPVDFSAPTARFLRPQIPYIDPDDDDSGSQNDSALLTLATSGAVYRVNLEDRMARSLFTTTNGDVIGGAVNVDEQAFVVVTRSNIEMRTLNGQSVWKVPYQSTYPRSMWVKVSRLAGSEEFAVWTGPYTGANRQNRIENRTYSHVLFVSGKRGLLRNVDLAGLPAIILPEQHLETLSLRIAALMMPPLPIFYLLLGWQKIPWTLVEISLGMAAVCALAGWLLGRRYRFPVGTQLRWAIFHLLCGVPGFIAFLCVQDWPARVACHRCGKMRVVEHARCELCDAGFAPAGKNGTEIFERLTANYPG